MSKVRNLVAVFAILGGLWSAHSEALSAGDHSAYLPLVLQQHPPVYAPGDYVEEFVSSGQMRRYRLHIPPLSQQGTPLPLVINLHGYNSNAEQQGRLSEMAVKADAEGFIAVHPEALGDPQTWHFGPEEAALADVRFIRELIQRLEERLRIDPARIFVTGMSNGAQMTNRLGCDLTDLIAAIAPVAGGQPKTQACAPSRSLPVVIFHGTEDRLLPYEGSVLFLPVREWAASWAARNGCGATPTVTFQHGDVTGETWGNCQDEAEVVLYTVEGGGHSWPGSPVMPPEITTHDINATEVIWEFFTAHPLL